MEAKRIFALGMTLVLIVLVGAFLIGCPAEETDEPEEIVKFAANEEFIVDQKGLQTLEKEYGLEFDEVYEIAIGLTHEALRAGDVDAAIGFTTDGKIEELDLIVLEDDKQVFPANNPAPVFREQVLESYPHIESVLAEVTQHLDNETKRQLNYQAAIEGNEPAEVARKWLLEEELITEEIKKPYEGKPVTIRSHEFTEHKILRYILVYALTNAGIPVEDRKHMVGTETIRGALLEGEIDAYWEYTGDAWRDIHLEDDTITDSDELYEKLTEKDIENELVWLDYAPINKTYTIMMDQERAEELDITTISELANWVEQVRSGEY